MVTGNDVPRLFNPRLKGKLLQVMSQEPAEAPTHCPDPGCGTELREFYDGQRPDGHVFFLYCPRNMKKCWNTSRKEFRRQT